MNILPGDRMNPGNEQGTERAEKPIPQVSRPSPSGLFLLNMLVFLVLILTPLLARGIWLYRAVILIEVLAVISLISLFIKSHMTAVTGTTRKEGAHNGCNPLDALRMLFGIPNQSVPGQEPDLLLSGILKITVFWGVIGIAIGILATHD
jgi:hypothetical protein